MNNELINNDVMNNNLMNQNEPAHGLQKPIALVDLDDTLFQTPKHIPRDLLPHVATFDKQGEPLSFMTDIQRQFCHWLLASTDLIAVTARSVEALSRVQLSFVHGAVCAHGAAILCPDGTLDREWHALMVEQLTPYQSRLTDLVSHIMQIAAANSIRAWIVEEEDLGIYVVVKQQSPTPFILKNLLMQIDPALLDGFYMHMNGNNLALLPTPVSKTHAVKFLLAKINANNQRVVLGWGDSLSDIGFLQMCHWWGMPQRSQVGQWLDSALTDHVNSEGGYDYRSE
jgi:hypothetical protein